VQTHPQLHASVSAGAARRPDPPSRAPGSLGEEHVATGWPRPGWQGNRIKEAHHSSWPGPGEKSSSGGRRRRRRVVNRQCGPVPARHLASKRRLPRASTSICTCRARARRPAAVCASPDSDVHSRWRRARASSSSAWEWIGSLRRRRRRTRNDQEADTKSSEAEKSQPVWRLPPAQVGQRARER